VRDALPLASFAASGDAFLLSDSSGRIRFVNRAAARLLECDADAAVGKRCWTVVHARTREGGTLCSAQCCAQRNLRACTPTTRQRGVRRQSSGATVEFELFTIHVPPSDGSEGGVLHLLVPESAPADLARPPVAAAADVDGVERLSARESEVLHALSCGRSTDAIAAHLFISPVTVRNHVRSILRKLRVHSRLDAVLTFTARRAPPPAPASAPERTRRGPRRR
jgi:DNA-binding CsgD family transcriptional regulator